MYIFNAHKTEIFRGEFTDWGVTSFEGESIAEVVKALGGQSSNYKFNAAKKRIVRSVPVDGEDRKIDYSIEVKEIPTIITNVFRLAVEV